MNLFDDLIFKNDPVYMRSLVGKSVKIITVENEQHIGIVYVIDPIFKTIVLHTKVSSQYKHDTVFILHHAIKSLETLSDEVDKTYLDQHNSKQESNEWAAEKSKLRKWLQHMYITVDEVGDYLKIDDHLVITPPYRLDNCICNNTIILEKIRNIISLMPPEFS